MMKKIIYTIGFLMFLSGPLAPLMIHAAEADPNTQDQSCNVISDPTCRVSSRIEYALRGKGNKGLDWGTSFGATEPVNVGKDLYLIVYKNTQSDTFGDAIKATAAQYGLPPERMSLILGGDLSPILERSPLIRIETAVNIYNQMVETYNDKKNSLEISATLKAKVEPNEIFADGDLGNSGFDLINDLNNIEIILFKKNDLVSFGGNYNSSKDSGSGSSNIPAGGTLPTTGKLPIDISGGVGVAGGSSSGSTEIETDKTPPADPFAVEKVDKSGAFLGGINPSICFAGDGVDKALDEFAKEAPSNSKLMYKPIGKVVKGSGASGSGVSSGGSGSGVAIDEAGFPIVVNNNSTNSAPLKAATPGDYSTPPLCDGIICMTLDFIKKPAVASFNKTDNCIQCHVQFINEGLQKTISHSLIPAKASGNLGESGLCKNAAGLALGSVGMNVSLSVVPIITPTKEDLVNLGSIANEWSSYSERNGAWNYGEKERRRLEAQKTGKPVDTSPVIETIERQLLIEINHAPDNSSQGQLLEKARSADESEKASAAQEQLVAEISKDAFGQVDALKALDDEMRAMNSFFTVIQKSMRTLIEDVPGLVSTKACIKLNETKVCT